MVHERIRAESLDVYSEPEIVAIYAEDTELQRAEQFIFEHLRGEIAGKAVLDIGVGAGRTTPHLVRMGARYTGIDLSSSMVTHCRKRYPDVAFAQCDATNMSRFHSGQFDFVLFSYNGMDSVSHQDRLRILREVHRILKPGGTFVFSAHNRHAPRYTLFDCFPKPSFVLNPQKLWAENSRRVSRYVKLAITHLKNRRREVQTDGYAILNDLTHGGRLMMYHIFLHHQIEQLQDLDFRDIEAVGIDGGRIEPGSNLDGDAWIHYIARKR